MRKIAIVSIIFILGFGGGFFYSHLNGVFRSAKETKAYPSAKADFPVSYGKRFVILTTAFNNKDFFQKNLLSVLEQDYENYRVVYIDDCSTEGSFEKVSDFLEKNDAERLVAYSRNESHLGQTESLYRAIHSCDPDEIVVLIDGSDFLAHPNVLKRLNQYYASPDVWFTFGNYAEYPHYSLGREKQSIENQELGRRCADTSPHLVTFYAGLFQRIKLQDFLVDGVFAFDGVKEISLTAMLEMAGEHTFFAHDILYLHNSEAQSSDSSIDSSLVDSIQNASPYVPLSGHPMHDFAFDENERVDVVVFSNNRPLQLYAFLESAERHLRDVHQMTVIYRVSSEAYDLGYEEVKKVFPNVMYLNQPSSPYEDCGPLLRRAVFDESVSSGRFVAFAEDNTVFKERVDLGFAAKKMQETGSYGFFFKLGCFSSLDQDMPPTISIGNDVYAWQFSAGRGDWAEPNRVDMVLYKKELIFDDFKCMKFHNPEILDILWAERKDLKRVGLCYNCSKAENLSLHFAKSNKTLNSPESPISGKELLFLFQQGLKMNLQQVEENMPSSGDEEPEPYFIQREKTL